ncbi:MAG: hypothetical protein CHACPFDD_00998 [Phycisphaerae bacterium]|nr:hypothetical protein [Phycisphaerae bacterium]
MDVGMALDLAREALIASLIIAGPILVAGITVGVIISLIQTVTQMQDQTLSIVPKIVAMVAAGIFFLPWVTEHVLEYARRSIGNM